MLVLDAELSEAEEAALAAAPGMVVVLGTVVAAALRNAELVLPVTTMAEENGTYVNRDRRRAALHPGEVPARHGAAGVVGGRRGARRGPGPSADAPSTAAEAFELLGERWPVFAGMSHADLGYTGRVLQGGGAPAFTAAGGAR